MLLPRQASASPQRGFTLIELLVVIAKAREKARQISCASIEKQLGLAFIQYVQDNDERFPDGDNSSAANNASTVNCGQGWAGEIYAYTKSTGIYKCPDDPTSGNYPVSYAANSNLLAPFIGTNALASQNAPASTVLLFEVAGAVAPTLSASPPTELQSWAGDSGPHDGLIGGSSSTGYATGLMATVNGTTLDTGVPTGRHTDGSNFLLADGHVKYMKGAAVSGGANAASSTSIGSNPSAAGTGALGTAAVTFSAI